MFGSGGSAEVGALEHHMLEEMGESRPVPGFDPEPDFIIDGHRDDGRGLVHGQDDFQAVVELAVFDGIIKGGHPGRESRQSQENRKDPENDKSAVNGQRDLLAATWIFFPPII
jgi:hypothetical protein